MNYDKVVRVRQKVQRISSKNATLKKMTEVNKLWVVDEVPEIGAWGPCVFEAEAELGDDVYRLANKWIGAQTSDFPRGRYARITKLHDVLSNTLGEVVLIVYNSDLLRGHIIDAFRSFTEKRILVILQGDISVIDVATRTYPSFYQRASYCMAVDDFFPGRA